WLFVAAKRKLADRARRHGAEKRGGGAALVPLDSWSDADPIVCGIYARILGPMDHAIAAETQAKLEAALARLNEEERQIIWLARIEGLPRAEVAQAMGKTEGAARTALSRALARLAKLMDGD
ncbi:MAG: sigma-70 family RNA polymerase sigma factor, partial [Planctomycetes bacterium]|nr:sigma-70 family RNA polymerase sigma factor [Planctomycetota bacterium]